MIKIKTENLLLDISDIKDSSLSILDNDDARQILANIWGAEMSDLSHYHAVFFDRSLSKLSYADSFISLSFFSHGYVADINEIVAVNDAQKQIEIDLEIINRESQWNAEESIYFDRWWPQPSMNREKPILEFGISLKDFYQKVFNRTLNRLILTRYGHILLNYSLSEADILADRPLSDFQRELDEICDRIVISEGYRYKDVDEDNDLPSRSRLINLILSSEIF